MDIKPAIRDYLAKQKNILCAYLFGSVSSGKDRKSSDVDIAVLFDRDVSREHYSEKSLIIMDDLSRILDRDIDIVILNKASSFLKFQIIKNGARIYERPDRTERDFEAKTIIEYFDFLPIRRRLEAALINNIKGVL